VNHHRTFTALPRPRLAAVLAMAAFLAACPRASGPGAVRREFDWFSISVPEDWSFSTYREGATRPGNVFTGSGVELRSPDGRFVEVHRDLGGAPLDSDAAWSASLTPTGQLRLAGADALCARQARPARWGEGLGPALCLAGDGRLDVLFRVEAGGRLYLFHLGNVARERAEDLEALRAMLRTFQAK
jgi:hypothetical protein